MLCMASREGKEKRKVDRKESVLVKPIPNHLTRSYTTKLNALAPPSFGAIENGQGGPADLAFSCRAYHAFNSSCSCQLYTPPISSITSQVGRPLPVL